MKSLRTLSALLVGLAIIRQNNGQTEGRTPFCDKCKCLNQTLENPDIDCSDAPISGDIYDPKYYNHDPNETTYPINSLNLQNNALRDITKPFPASSLKKLDLSHNYIRSIANLAFANLTELEELVLSYNNLDAFVPEVFKGDKHVDGFDYPLMKLRILRLDGNQLHTLNNDIFQHIDNQLEVLSLSHNPLKMIDQQTNIAITQIVNLKTLDLSYTQLKKLPRSFMHTPKYLTSLDLSGNLFETIPQSLSDSHGLETLYFNDNQIVSLNGSTVFPSIPTLKVLHMCKNSKLEELGPHSLAGLSNLTELYLMDNVLSKLSSKTLEKPDFANQDWPPLRKLSLYNNKLTNLELEFLPHWDNLKMIDIRANPWVCDCENEWLLEVLMPIIINLNKSQAQEVLCGAPIEMQGKHLYNLTEAHSNMRCLDLYGNRPENDGSVLIGVLVGLLIAIPLMLFLMYAYQRHWFGLFDKSPAAYSRQFYKTTPTDEGF